MNESTSCTMSSTKRIVVLNTSMILVIRGIMSYNSKDKKKTPAKTENFRGANRMEDCEDETSDGELKPSFKRKKFNLKQAQRNLRKIFAEKWPFSNVDSAKTPKCYACYWLNVKKGGCRGKSCDGKCCGVCLKSDYIRQSAALSNEEANRLYEVTEKQLNRIYEESIGKWIMQLQGAKRRCLH